eukprot:GHVT01082690.1.p1 GENE.GHVT01082690.1~~GHVT01082690.1.p1  ORF type:complete len:160 (-),score=18.61 GHVT01082690.1:657-1136(-)
MGLRRFVQLRPPGASAARALVKALTAVYVLAARSDCFRSAGRPALLPASARVVTGRVGPVPTTSRDAAWLGSFCYSVGTGQRGTFKAQILVTDSPQSKPPPLGQILQPAAVSKINYLLCSQIRLLEDTTCHMRGLKTIYWGTRGAPKRFQRTATHARHT